MLSTRAISVNVSRRGLFDYGPPPRRSRWSVPVSLVVHALAIGVIGTLASIRVPLPGVRPRQVLAYIALSAPPVPTELLLPPPEALKPPEPPPQPEPEPSIETPVLEEKPAPPEPEPPVPEVVRPAPKPDVRVGLFAKDSQPAAAALPPREVVPAGFDSNPAAAANLNLRVSSTGAFDAAAGAAARPGTAKGLVAATGFDQRTAVVSSAGRAIAATGFQAAQAVAATPPQRAVHQSGFGDVQPAPTERPAAAKPVGPTTPVEVLFKPLPAYTDEARAQHIEGEIILEVDFMASGEVHVVRVVHGLGHGLDDMAVEAATHIRFKPALEQGRPIDFRTDVRILFRLA